MKPTRAYYAGLGTGFKGQVPFAAMTLGVVVPLKQAYTPGPNLVIGGVVPANFDGSTAIAQSGVPIQYTDPGTGDIIINLTEPAGGWQWVTSGITNLPQTIYGFALLTADSSILVAVTDPLDNPITLDAVGQGIDAGPLTFRIPVGNIV